MEFVPVVKSYTAVPVQLPSALQPPFMIVSITTQHPRREQKEELEKDEKEWEPRAVLIPTKHEPLHCLYVVYRCCGAQSSARDRHAIVAVDLNSRHRLRGAITSACYVDASSSVGSAGGTLWLGHSSGAIVWLRFTAGVSESAVPDDARIATSVCDVKERHEAAVVSIATNYDPYQWETLAAVARGSGATTPQRRMQKRHASPSAATPPTPVLSRSDTAPERSQLPLDAAAATSMRDGGYVVTMGRDAIVHIWDAEEHVLSRKVDLWQVQQQQRDGSFSVTQRRHSVVDAFFFPAESCSLVVVLRGVRKVIDDDVSEGSASDGERQEDQQTDEVSPLLHDAEEEEEEEEEVSLCMIDVHAAVFADRTDRKPPRTTVAPSTHDGSDSNNANGIGTTSIGFDSKLFVLGTVSIPSEVTHPPTIASRCVTPQGYLWLSTNAGRAIHILSPTLQIVASTSIIQEQQQQEAEQAGIGAGCTARGDLLAAWARRHTRAREQQSVSTGGAEEEEDVWRVAGMQPLHPLIAGTVHSLQEMASTGGRHFDPMAQSTKTANGDREMQEQPKSNALSSTEHTPLGTAIVTLRRCREESTAASVEDSMLSELSLIVSCFVKKSDAACFFQVVGALDLEQQQDSVTRSSTRDQGASVEDPAATATAKRSMLFSTASADGSSVGSVAKCRWTLTRQSNSNDIETSPPPDFEKFARTVLGTVVSFTGCKFWVLYSAAPPLRKSTVRSTEAVTSKDRRAVLRHKKLQERFGELLVYTGGHPPQVSASSTQRRSSAASNSQSTLRTVGAQAVRKRKPVFYIVHAGIELTPSQPPAAARSDHEEPLGSEKQQEDVARELILSPLPTAPTQGTSKGPGLALPPLLRLSLSPTPAPESSPPHPTDNAARGEPSVRRNEGEQESPPGPRGHIAGGDLNDGSEIFHALKQENLQLRGQVVRLMRSKNVLVESLLSRIRNFERTAIRNALVLHPAAAALGKHRDVAALLQRELQCAVDDYETHSQLLTRQMHRMKKEHLDNFCWVEQTSRQSLASAMHGALLLLHVDACQGLEAALRAELKARFFRQLFVRAMADRMVVQDELQELGRENELLGGALDQSMSLVTESANTRGGGGARNGAVANNDSSELEDDEEEAKMLSPFKYKSSANMTGMHENEACKGRKNVGEEEPELVAAGCDDDNDDLAVSPVSVSEDSETGSQPHREREAAGGFGAYDGRQGHMDVCALENDDDDEDDEGMNNAADAHSSQQIPIAATATTDALEQPHQQQQQDDSVVHLFERDTATTRSAGANNNDDTSMLLSPPIELVKRRLLDSTQYSDAEQQEEHQIASKCAALEFSLNLSHRECFLLLGELEGATRSAICAEWLTTYYTNIDKPFIGGATGICLSVFQLELDSKTELANQLEAHVVKLEQEAVKQKGVMEKQHADYQRELQREREEHQTRATLLQQANTAVSLSTEDTHLVEVLVTQNLGLVEALRECQRQGFVLSEDLAKTLTSHGTK